MNLICEANTQSHPAVERCLAAGRAALQHARQQSLRPYECEEAFKGAFLEALPGLTSHENVCDFIACVTYAMIIGVLYEKEARSYLFAAQTALGAVRRPSQNPKSGPAQNPATEAA